MQYSYFPVTGSSGGITSINGDSTPAQLIVGGSGISVSTAGGTTTITNSLVPSTEPANTVYAGPTSGSAAMPTFRALVLADIPSLSSLYVTQSEVGAANGVASLDGSGKIPVGQLPSVVMEYRGTWNPSTNTPSLSDGTGTNGYVYWVTTAFAGPISGLNNASMVNFQIGDLVLYSSALGQWELTTPAAGVSSVNGAQGAVTVNAINQLTGDVTAGPASGSQSQAATLATVNANVGSFTYASITVDAKGRITAASSGTPPTSGTVTSVSVVSANGLSGSVANPTTTPAITLSPTFTGISYSTGTAFQAAIAANFPTLNQNTTGTAANITATSNSTLTTLSALSLPTSQLSGNISLTSQVSGTLPLGNGGTGQTSASAAFAALSPLTTAGDIIYENSTPAPARLPIGTTGQVLTVSGGLPSWQTATVGANTTLSNLVSPTAINQNLLFGTDATYDIGGPYPTAAGRPAHVWASTALIAGSSGHTYLYEATLELGLNSGSSGLSWTIVSGEMVMQVGGTTYVFIESNTLSDLGTIQVGAPSGNGATAGFLTSAYQVSTNTQAHMAVGVGNVADLSSGYSTLAAGQPAFVSMGVVNMRSDAANNTFLGTGSVSTSAVGPFPYFPTCAGTPTGTPASTNYAFFISTTSGSVTAGATYTNNGQTFTALNSITLASTGQYLVCTGTGAPSSSGTLTKSSGTGTTPISFTSATTSSITGMSPMVIDSTDSIPYWNIGGSWVSQVGNITATNNSTLTTLSALSLPLSQTTGTLGISHGGTGVTSVTTAPTATSFAGWDSNSNLSANNFLSGYTSTPYNSGGTNTVTLTVSSTYQQYFTGVGSQVVVLPVVSTLVKGFSFLIVNNTAMALPVQSSGTNTIITMPVSSSCIFTCIATTGTGTASWDSTAPISSGGSVQAVNVGGTGTSTGPTQYGIIYGANANAYASTTAGTAGQVLTSNGTSAPTFSDVPTTVLTANSSSSNYSSTTSGNYVSAASCSVTLTPGIWEVMTYFFLNTGPAGTVGYYATSGLYGATGTDTSTPPTALGGTVTGPTNYDGNLAASGDVIEVAQDVSGQGINTNVPPIRTIIKVTTNTTIYAVPRAYYSAASTGFMRSFINARQLQ